MARNRASAGFDKPAERSAQHGGYMVVDLPRDEVDALLYIRRKRMLNRRERREERKSAKSKVTLPRFSWDE